MKTLIVYDSVFGNTEKIAQAIGNALSFRTSVEMLRVGDAKLEHLTDLDVLVVGSPTRVFKPTKTITNFLKSISKKGLKGVKVAAFDTRLTMSVIEESRVLLFFVRLFGYAAKPIAEKLKGKGGKPTIPPEGFFVKGMEGPLEEGEIERATSWAKEIVKSKDWFNNETSFRRSRCICQT